MSDGRPGATAGGTSQRPQSVAGHLKPSGVPQAIASALLASQFPLSSAGPPRLAMRRHAARCANRSAWLKKPPRSPARRCTHSNYLSDDWRLARATPGALAHRPKLKISVCDSLRWRSNATVARSVPSGAGPRPAPNPHVSGSLPQKSALNCFPTRPLYVESRAGTHWPGRTAY